MVAQHDVRDSLDSLAARGGELTPNPTGFVGLARKTRLVLNFKQIPYSTSYLSYPDIKAALESDRFPSSGLLSKGGKGPWTLPAVCPPTSDAGADTAKEKCPALNESFAIALALDERFPSADGRQVFPDRPSMAFARVVQGLFDAGITMKGCVRLASYLAQDSDASSLLADSLPIHASASSLTLWVRYIPSHLLDDRGAAYFTRTREERFGKPLDEVGTPDDRSADLAALIEALKPITWALDAAAKKSGQDSSSSPYLMGGELPTYADLIVLGFLAWAHRAEVAAGEAIEPQGGWFGPLLDADGGGLGRLWKAGRALVEGQGLGVVEWKAGTD